MHSDAHDTLGMKPGHFAGLQFQDNWWFVQVLNVSTVELKPWILLNENGNRDVIAADTSTEDNPDSVQDNQSDLLLEPNDDERNIIHQILVGVAPSRMQIYPRFSREQNLNLEDSITPGEDAHWITGYDSPYNNPSSQSEIFHINDMADLKFVAHNPMDEPEEARLSFYIRQLEYATVTDVNRMKAMLQGQKPAKKVSMGLGVPDYDRVRIPAWVKQNFGEHLYSTVEILNQGDASKRDGETLVEGQADLQG